MGSYQCILRQGFFILPERIFRLRVSLQRVGGVRGGGEFVNQDGFISIGPREIFPRDSVGSGSFLEILKRRMRMWLDGSGGSQGVGGRLGRG